MHNQGFQSGLNKLVATEIDLVGIPIRNREAVRGCSLPKRSPRRGYPALRGPANQLKFLSMNNLYT